MLGLQLKCKEIFDHVFAILVRSLERLAPGLQNGIECLICVLLLVMARSLVHLVEDRVSRAQSLHELDRWI